MKKETECVPSQVHSNGYTRADALLSVGTGWASLINEIFDKMESHAISVTIVQVKEKYGGLRVYSIPYDEDFDKFLIEIEKRSFTICEDCGKTGQLRKGGWYRTLCDEHAEGREAISPF